MSFSDSTLKELATATPSTYKLCPFLSYPINSSFCSTYTISLACNSYYTVVGCSGQLTASLGYSFPPSQRPSMLPSYIPTKAPTMQPSFNPTMPSSKPSMQPSQHPSSWPTCQPSSNPSLEPFSRPTSQPSAQPSTKPSHRPSSQPSQQPYNHPSSQPSQQPFNHPSSIPSEQPSHSPTLPPSRQPSTKPSSIPSRQPTAAPSSRPSSVPSRQPSHKPSAQPTIQPTNQPSSIPSLQASTHPSAQPSRQPSFLPSRRPSSQPSKQPTNIPTRKPSCQPISMPSRQPTTQPSFVPSRQPSTLPTRRPSNQPSSIPSRQPTNQPSNQPSGRPSTQPNGVPSSQPSMHPSTQPSIQPSSQLSLQPSGQPSFCPSVQPSQQPSSIPSMQPSAQPSRQPSSQPNAVPTVQPSSHPTVQPSSFPTVQPSQQPSSHPSRQPSSRPSMQPSQQPFASPSMQPSSVPSIQPSIQPTSTPSMQPSMQSTMQPSSLPSRQPSMQPTSQPSDQPTTLPSDQPTFHPSCQPSNQPSAQPSTQPSKQPSVRPSCQPSNQPSMQPSIQTSTQPTTQPSSQPSVQPLAYPSSQPSMQPSRQPSELPSYQPSPKPTEQPSRQPSSIPSTIPSKQPTEQPTRQPTSSPSIQPTRQPSFQPSTQPSNQPSMRPTSQPLSQPSMLPSCAPTMQPSLKPSGQPSRTPSAQPSYQPSIQPTSIPSMQPTVHPSSQPSMQPSSQPSTHPSNQPSGQPTSPPTMQPSLQPNREPSSQPSDHPSAQPSSLPSAQPSRLPTDQPSKQPSGQPSSVPSRIPSSQPSSFPSSIPSRLPSSQPSAQPSRQPSQATPYAKYLPRISLTEISNVDSTSLTIQLILDKEGLVNFGVFHISQTKASITAAAVLSQELSTRTNNFVAIKSITGLVPSTSYHLFIVLQSLNGIRSIDDDVRRTEQNFTTLCCRTFSMVVNAPTVWQSIAVTETLRNWLTITVTNAPQTSMFISLSVYNSSGSIMPRILSPSEFTIAAAVSPFIVTPIILSASLLVSSSFNTGEYTVYITNTNADYNVATNEVQFQVIAKGQALPAPLISSSTFSGDGSSITVILDSNSDYGGFSPIGAFICNLLFQFKCSSISRCFWTSAKSVLINIAANDKCAAPGDVIAFSTQSALSAQCPTISCPTQSSWPLSNSTMNFTITAPTIAQAPTVILKLPSLIGNCTALTVDWSSSIGSAGRSWSSLNLSVTGGSRSGVEAAEIRSYLSARLYQAFPITVPAGLFKAGESYTFIVELCNFLGSCGQSSATVGVQAVNLPTIILLTGGGGSGSILQSTRSKALTITAAMKLNPCSDPSSTVGVTYSWQVINTDTNSIISFQSLSRNPSVLIIPAYTTVVGGSYDVVATVRLGSLFNNATQSINIVQGALIACINGCATRLLAIGQAVSLDGGCSRDENTNSLTGLHLFWACSVLSVPNMNCSWVIDYDSFTTNSSTVKVVAQAKTGNIALQLRMTLTVSESEGSRSSSASVVVTIVSSDAMDISLATVSAVSSTGKVNPGDVFSIAATLSPPITAVGTGNYSWKISPPIAISMILTPVSKSFSLLANQQSYVVVAANSLTADITYTFTLTAFAGASRSENSLSVLINSPPKPGIFTIDPSSGVALVDSFSLYSSGWVDTDLPISYRYSYLSLSDNELPLRSANELTYVSLLLPAGSVAKNHMVECYATIYDALYAYSTSSAVVQSVPNVLSGTQTTALVANFLAQAATSVNNSQVDEITQAITAVSSLLNIVNCSLAPNCSLLNRAECSSTSHTCGTCISNDFVGQTGNSNSACISLADLHIASSVNGRRRLQDLLFAQCPSNCSGHGTCSFYSYRTREKVTTCYQTSLNCYAQCDCEVEYSLSASCSSTDQEIEPAADQRSSLISTILSLYTLQNPSQQSLQNSVASLQEAAGNTYQLTSNSVDTLLTTANAMSNDASTLAADNITTNSLAGLLNVFDSISSATIANSSSSGSRKLLYSWSNNSTSSNLALAGNVIAGIQAFAAIASSSLLPGQPAFESSYSNFKLSVSNFSRSSTCDTHVTLAPPKTSLEQALGISSPNINVPLCSNSSNSLGVSTLTLSRSLFQALSPTATEWQSNPLIMSFSSFPSTNTSTRVEMVLPLIQNFSLITEEPELVQHSCKAEDFSMYEYRCSSGRNASITCLGEKQTLQVQCPYPQVQPTCNVLSPQTGEMDEGKCWQVAFTADNVTCSCPLLALPSNNSGYQRRMLSISNSSNTDAIPTGTVSVSYVGILSVVAKTFTATVLSAQRLNGSVINRGRDALITVGTLVAVMILAMVWSYRTDGIQRKVEHDALMMKKSKHQLQATANHAHKNHHNHLHHLRRNAVIAAVGSKAKHVHVKENALALAEEALPGILTSKSITDRAKDEIKRHHRWLGVIFHYSESFPRLLRVVSLTTNVTIMLFMQSITYNITKGDDGSCSLLTTEATCLQPSSPYSPGASKCYWTPSSTVSNGGVCAFVEPDNSLKIVLFIAIFSAIVTTPIALAVDWLIQKVLSAPTAIYRNRSNKSAVLAVITAPTTTNFTSVVSVTSGNNSNNSLGIVRRRNQQSNLAEATDSQRNATRQAQRMSKVDELQSLANADFKALAEGVRLYRTTLTNEQEKKEFDVAWGLNQRTGCFEGLDPEDDQNIMSNDTQSSLLSRLQAIMAAVRGNKNQSNVPHLLKVELELLHKRFKDEQKVMVQLHTSHYHKREQSKRLLFLFQADLLPGVKGQILESKDRRNNGKVKSVSKSAKTIAWFLIFIMNTGMLFYVFLFAVSQTQVRQRAWAQSFAIWLVLEILFVSSSVVLFMHVLIPSIIMKDVHQIQKKLVGNIKQFYKEMHRKEKLKYAPKGNSKADEEELTEFNAAKYLFLSHRVASMLISNDDNSRGDKATSIAEMILHFSTPWPKQSYQHSVDVAKNYNRKFTALTRSLSLIVFYFLTNFLAVPLTIQDMIVHIVATTSIGYTILLHIQLYEIYPVLVVVPTVMILALVHFIVQANHAQNRIKRQKLLLELHSDENKAADEEEVYEADAHALTEDALHHHRRQHVNRRHSLQQGLRVAQRLEKNINNDMDDSDCSLSFDISSDSSISNNFRNLMRLDALSLSSDSIEEEKESLSDFQVSSEEDQEDDVVDVDEGIHTPRAQRKRQSNNNTADLIVSASSSSLSSIRLSVAHDQSSEKGGGYTFTSSSSSSAASGLTLSDAEIDAVFETHSQRESIKPMEEEEISEDESGGFELTDSSASNIDTEDADDNASN